MGGIILGKAPHLLGELGWRSTGSKCGITPAAIAPAATVQLLRDAANSTSWIRNEQTINSGNGYQYNSQGGDANNKRILAGIPTGAT